MIEAHRKLKTRELSEEIRGDSPEQNRAREEAYRVQILKGL